MPHAQWTIRNLRLLNHSIIAEVVRCVQNATILTAALRKLVVSLCGGASSLSWAIFSSIPWIVVSFFLPFDDGFFSLLPLRHLWRRTVLGLSRR